MYRLTREPTSILSDFLSETSEIMPSYDSEYSLTSLFGSDMSNKRSGFGCVLMTLVKLLIVIFLAHWIYRRFICKKEHFDISKPQKDSTASLHDLLTADCRPEYCGTSDWPVNNSKKQVKLPEGYSLFNLSTTDGCCIVPNILKDYISVSHANNSSKMSNVESELKIKSYIRD